jgi:hypothetical protein
MQLTEAATLDRKSGKPRDLRFCGPIVEMFFFKTPTKSSS